MTESTAEFAVGDLVHVSHAAYREETHDVAVVIEVIADGDALGAKYRVWVNGSGRTLGPLFNHELKLVKK